MRAQARPIFRWLLLTLLGWLAYALLKSTGALIQFGFPWYDWQWYLSLISLVLIATLKLARWWPTRLNALWISITLILWLLVSYSGFGQTLTLQPATQPISLSFWGGEEINTASDSLLTDLQAAHGQLYLNVSADSFQGKKRLALLNTLNHLNAHHIDVYLDVNASNYISTPVSAEWVSNVRQTADFVQTEHLSNVRGLIGDAELPYRLPLDFYGWDSQNFDNAVHSYDSLITSLNQTQPNLQLGFTAMWPQYVDQWDGDSDLARILRSPIDPAPRWTYLNLMAYSSYLPDPAWRPYLLYVAETQLSHQYPNQPISYLIGIVGHPTEPLLTFDELVRDARLSRALGANDVVIFRLQGALQQFGPDFVRKLTSQVNDPAQTPPSIPFARPVSLLLFAQLFLDSLLDLSHWPGLLALAWAFLIALRVRQRPH